MANANPFRFRWEISEPFMGELLMSAYFYTVSPDTRQWKVLVAPDFIYTQEWRFYFCVEVAEGNVNADWVLTESLKVQIYLDGTRAAHQYLPNFVFHEGNHHKYGLSVVAATNPRRKEAHQLNIEVEIAFHPFINEIPPGHGLFYNPEDLTALSESMRKLFNSAVFWDTSLQPRNPTEAPLPIIRVHYFLLAVRWEGLLRRERLNAPSAAAVQTYMSRSVLMYILVYMYSAVLDKNLLDFGDLASTAELFQVMDQHRIHHLYQVFVRRESRPVRQTVTDVKRYSKNFPLGFDLAEGVSDPSYVWEISRDDSHKFLFRIQFFMERNIPQFQYCMTSTSYCKAHVNLELVRRETRESGVVRVESWDVHHRYDTIGSGVRNTINPGVRNTFNRSRQYSFDGDAAPLDDLRRGRFISRGIRYICFIRCSLSLSDGKTCVVIKSEGDGLMQTDEERFEVLSDHLRSLLQRQIHTDMRILCLDSDSYQLHRAILENRIPEWRLGLRRYQRRDNHEVACTEVNGPAFRAVLDYMYTGKTFQIDVLFLDEIEQLAKTVDFKSLISLLSRLHPV